MPSASAPARRRPPVSLSASGLTALTRVHAVHSAGDAIVAISLAGTLFFSVPVGEARGRVALYLLTTVAPFAVLAPVIGPALDRARRGRRAAIAGSLLARGLLAWLMARAAGGLALYPAAFGVLVLSKAYGVARSAAVPRVITGRDTLLSANARLTATGFLAAAVAAPLGAGVSALLDHRWTLRLAALVFAAAAIAVTGLPASVNSARTPGAGGGATGRRLRFAEPVRAALVGAAVLRGLAGFLTMFLAFLLRSQDAGPVRFALLAGAAAAGGLGGTVVGSRLGRRRPEALLSAALLVAAASCAAAAVLFSAVTALLVVGLSSLAGSLSKLSLDAVLQRDVADEVRGQAFARSETTLQLAWVLGGLVGIVLPLRGGLGLGLAAAALAPPALLMLRGPHRPRVG